MNDVKAFLTKIELYDAHITSLTQDIQSLQSMATKVTACMNQVAVSGSGSQDKLGDAVAKIVDLEGRIQKKVCKYTELKEKVIELIEKVEDPKQVMVLYKRYAEYKPWEEIACDLKCTFRNVCYIHGKALQAMEQVLKDEGVASEEVKEC